MATLLNKKVAYLTIRENTVTNELLANGAVDNRAIADNTIEFPKTKADFATKLLDTTKRAVFPFIGGVVKSVVGGSTDVSADLAGVAASAAAPAYNPATRTWDNLGAVVYAPDNKVYLRAPGPTASPDATETVKDTDGAEVYGRLTKVGEVWTASYFHMVGGVETPYVFAVATDAFLIYKQWVPGSSALLEDQGRFIISAPGAVDITETNNIEQLAKDLGIVLGNNGQMSLGQSFTDRIAAHVDGTAEKHETNDVMVDASVVITGLLAGSTLAAALNKLQQNIGTASGDASGELKLYFNELRSNGVLGATATGVAGVGLQVDLRAMVVYVQGTRYVIGAQAVNVPDEAVTYLWVAANGTIQQGVAYPGVADTHARLGRATAAAGAVVFLSQHRALVELDQKVYDIEDLLNTHIASAAAHGADSITYSNAVAALLKADGLTPVAKVQEAIEALVRRFNAVRFHTHRVELTQAMIDTATVEGALKYIEIALPGGQTYEVGQEAMSVMIDGDDQDLGLVFTEPSETAVRVYFDPAPEETLVAGQVAKLRWLAV